MLADQERLDQHRGDLRGLEERLAGHRAERDRVRGEVEELRVTQARLRQDAEHLALQFPEQFGRPRARRPMRPRPSTRRSACCPLPRIPTQRPPRDPPRDRTDEPADDQAAGTVLAFPAKRSRASAQAAAPLNPPQSAADLVERETELARCKDALDRLGPVNLLAVQEHDEQEERHEFLTAQRADVADSVESLRKTIHEINEASAERFRATFAEVNKAFGEVFARLFRGGEAEMRLLDEQDVLESGIEIVARPPASGCRTSCCCRAARRRSPPSPCSSPSSAPSPRPSASSTRSTRRSTTSTPCASSTCCGSWPASTQFIVITHNKLTMEAARTLYGVTMEEHGVSKLVAV